MKYYNIDLSFLNVFRKSDVSDSLILKGTQYDTFIYTLNIMILKPTTNTNKHDEYNKNTHLEIIYFSKSYLSQTIFSASWLFACAIYYASKT